MGGLKVELKKTLIEDFEKVFNDIGDLRVFFAPGRVNLIGEHIDYNGGFVFPCALDFGTYGVVRKRTDKIIRMYSKNFKNNGIIEFELNDLINEKSHYWANYPKGVIKVLKDEGYNIDCGLDILFYGNIPNKAGLSSSASIELTMGVILNNIFNLNIDMISLIQRAKKAENEFIGVQCGIMDQFAIGMGKKDNAILLNCNTLEYKYAPISLNDYVILISNTNKQRGLADSKYNERRRECEQALEKIKRVIPIDNLCDLSIEEFEKNKELIDNDKERKRAKHAVYENARTKKAVKALKEKDLIEFGKLMIQSHDSLKEDYEVTGIELDTLVELALKERGVLGSRMTGAGFGGCSVSIVKKDLVYNFIQNVGRKYAEIMGYKPSFYVANIGFGAREI